MFVQFLTERVFILLPTKQLSPSFILSKKYIYIKSSGTVLFTLNVVLEYRMLHRPFFPGAFTGI